MPPHTDAAHAAITTELVRLTLPHRADSDRPALYQDLPSVTPARIRTKGRTR